LGGLEDPFSLGRLTTFSGDPSKEMGDLPHFKPMAKRRCKKCGRCCDPIRLSKRITPDLIPDSAPEGWLQRHWHLIKAGIILI